MISVALVILRIFLRRGIENPEQLEEIGINVYASIPVSETFAKKVIQAPSLRKRSTPEYQSLLLWKIQQIWL